MQDENKKPNVSDAELDALLAEWAEAEIEPPAGFHEEMMNRLRKEAQPKKKNNIVTLFAKNKRWTSVAAAAVLVLFCVPVVQGQFGSDATERVKDAEIQVQMAQNSDSTEQSGANSSNALQGESDQSNTADVKTSQKDNAQAVQSKTETPDKKTVMSAVTIPDMTENSKENGIAVAQTPAEDENMPMIAAFSLEDDMASEEEPAAYSYRNGSFDEEESLESLEQKLSDAEEMLAEYQAQLEEHPEDSTLQERITEQQNIIDALKQKIEEWKTKNTAEQQAE